MIKLLLVFLIMMSFAKGFAASELSLSAGTYVESNVYYTDQGELADGSLRIAPKWKYIGDQNTDSFTAELAGSYNKYVQYSNQDYFDYGGNLLLPINPEGKWTFFLSGGGEKISEPAISNKKVTYPEGTILLPTRNERHSYNGNLGIRYKWTGLSTFRVNGGVTAESYSDKNHQYLNNMEMKGDGYYDYQFLPETTFFIGGMMGMKSYPTGTKNKNSVNRSTEIKYNSQFIEGRMGVRGRLAEKTRVDASGALQLRTYAQSSGFSEPVFNLKIEEQFSPKDLLIAGYDYDINDSKWTNFVVDQTTYIGYARILGDQVLLLSRLNYTYSSYSKPIKREDQRLSGRFKIDYSFSPKVLLSGMFELDVLNSDQFNSLNELPDKPVSYEAFKAGLTLTSFF